MNTVCCFGELLLRLAPAAEWGDDNSLSLFIGGAELNTATALSNWNVPVKYITALPDNHSSKQVVAEIRKRNINVDDVVFSGGRTGTYYLPVGEELKATGLIYDRAHSSFSELKPGAIDWDKVLHGCGWFHFSAISPALTQNTAAVCKEAVEAASAKGLTVSVDLNYRSQLWQWGEQPDSVMLQLAKYCNVVMGNLWAVESLLDITSPIKESKGHTKEELMEAARSSVAEMRRLFPKVSAVAYTFRLADEYFAVLQKDSKMESSRTFAMNNVVDKVGSGDCFMAGLIYGLLQNHSPKETVDFAAAAAVGKLQERGDRTAQTTADVKQILTQG